MALEKQIVARVIGKNDRDPFRAAIVQRQPLIQKRMMGVDHVHRLQEFLGFGLVAKGQRAAVKALGLFCVWHADGRIVCGGRILVKLVLRNKEYEVKPGMTLLSALEKISILPESVIATREGEMILEDEILKDGDLIKLIAVISGG
jgi:sulfur carrier protein